MKNRNAYVWLAALLVAPRVLADAAAQRHDLHPHEHHPVPLLQRPLPDRPSPPAEAVAAAFPDLGPMPVHGAHAPDWLFQLPRLEWQRGDGEESLAWRAEFWWGGDRDRLRLSSRGERAGGRSEVLKTGLYWQRFVAPWWQTQLGLRQDGGERGQRAWLEAGLQGQTPWFVDLGVRLAVGEGGHAELAIETDYSWRLTRHWLLASDLELTLRSRDDPRAGLARGWSRTEAGLRLHYEVRPELAPYIGLEWTHYPGRSADLRADGERRRLVAGLRFWF